MTKKINVLTTFAKKTLKKAKLLKECFTSCTGFYQKTNRENIAVKLVPKKTRWHMNFN